MSLRRTHHDVKAAILKSCVFNSLSISQLLLSQNLSYKILKPTLSHLASCKLVEYEIDGRRKLVRTTDQGLIALEAYENAIALLQGGQRTSSVELTRARVGSWNNVIEQKDRTSLQRPIIFRTD
jgi:predicted transcriptional regulator